MTLTTEVMASEFLPTELAVESTPATQPISVLVVEDDPDAAELVRIHLSSSKDGEFSVERARNLRQAMRRLSQPGIDIVLLDLGLPELSGYRSHRAILHVAPPHVPVVIFTSDERSLSRDITLQFGAADYLLKNETSPTQLKQALRAAISRLRLETSRELDS